jgi:CheY-like chemotaxis protein
MPPSGRILVIEDNPFQQALLVASLTELGFDVTTAEDGLEALRLARVWPPDAFVTDALVPGLDGFELCRVIRQDPRIAHIPVVLSFTGPLAEVDSYLAREMGCNALVQRQSDSAEVIEALLACLRQDLKRLPVIDGAPIHFAAYGKAGVDWERPA